MKHIRIISPSGAINPQLILRAQQRLQSWGYHVTIGQYAMQQYGRFAGTAQQRLSDINQALADPSIDIILCSRGGYGLQQIVDKIVLPTRPKEEWPLVVGFSDVTILHALMSVNGVPSLHASMCKALATLQEDDTTLMHLRNALETGRMWENAVFAGKPIVGGNLSVLYGLQGTLYSLNAIIDKCETAPWLLIEDICERHYHIDRMLNNLRMSGVLDRVSGVIVGQFTDCDDDPKMNCTVQQTIAQILSGYDFPIIWNAPYGHIDGNEPILLL